MREWTEQKGHVFIKCWAACMSWPESRCRESQAPPLSNRLAPQCLQPPNRAHTRRGEVRRLVGWNGQLSATFRRKTFCFLIEESQPCLQSALHFWILAFGAISVMTEKTSLIFHLYFAVFIHRGVVSQGIHCWSASCSLYRSTNLVQTKVWTIVWIAMKTLWKMNPTDYGQKISSSGIGSSEFLHVQYASSQHPCDPFFLLCCHGNLSFTLAMNEIL